MLYMKFLFLQILCLGVIMSSYGEDFTNEDNFAYEAFKYRNILMHQDGKVDPLSAKQLAFLESMLRNGTSEQKDLAAWVLISDEAVNDLFDEIVKNSWSRFVIDSVVSRIDDLPDARISKEAATNFRKNARRNQIWLNSPAHGVWYMNQAEHVKLELISMLRGHGLIHVIEKSTDNPEFLSMLEKETFIKDPRAWVQLAELNKYMFVAPMMRYLESNDEVSEEVNLALLFLQQKLDYLRYDATKEIIEIFLIMEKKKPSFFMHTVHHFLHLLDESDQIMVFSSMTASDRRYHASKLDAVFRSNNQSELHYQSILILLKQAQSGSILEVIMKNKVDEKRVVQAMRSWLEADAGAAHNDENLRLQVKAYLDGVDQ